MADIANKVTRSRMVSSVRSTNTKIELEIRHCLFASGFRYHLHRKDLLDKPDMFFFKHSAVIFVNGCFWYYHGCHLSSIPSTRKSWWRKKLERSRIWDQEVVLQLQELCWRVLTI